MKTTKYVLAIALGVVALVAAPAYADTITDYTINFTTTFGGPAPVSGSFTYDSTIQQFTNFLVTWGGNTFDLTASANSPFIFGTGTGCTGEGSTPAFGFMLLSQSLSGCTVTYEWHGTAFMLPFPGFTFNAFTPPFSGATIFGGASLDVISAAGNWTVQPSAVPEPSPIILLGSGLLGLVAAARRKRLG